MRKILFPLCLMLSIAMAHAGNGDSFFTVNAGFLFNSTLNASFGYERELSYSDAVEVFGEIGDRWHKDPVCGHVCDESFWKDYYWGGGVLYKKQLRRFKNASLRLRIGPECGAHTGDYFFALEGGLEFNYVFPNRMQFSVIQKNQVGFFHGDTFRNGIMIGLRCPI